MKYRTFWITLALFVTALVTQTFWLMTLVAAWCLISVTAFAFVSHLPTTPTRRYRR